MTTEQATKRAEAIEKQLKKLRKRVEKAGWRIERGEPVLPGSLQEVPGVGTIYHPRGGPNTESELIEPDRLDLTKRHHMVYRLRALREELVRVRRAGDRERRRRMRERQADARREAARRAAERSSRARRTRS